MNNLFKSIAQGMVNSALPMLKAGLKARATTVALNPKYAAVVPILLPFLDDILDGWTIKL